jgi:lantibiotic biosynthesis protein
MHSIDICFDIASKMRNPHQLVDNMNNQIKRGLFSSSEWPNTSLAWGLSGIVCFYAMMDLNFPNEGWEKVAHDYLLLAKDRVETNTSSDVSLFSGLTGLSVATYLCSHKGCRYQKMLSTLDETLIREVQAVFLRKSDRFLDAQVPIPQNYYNLASGLSGILTYLISRDDSLDLKNLAQDCLNNLVKILSEFKEINGSKVPAWYISLEDEIILENKEKFPKGIFKLDIPYGLPGVLAALSLAEIKGYKAFGLIELISRMSDWIKNKQTIQTHQINWKPFISIEEELEGISEIPKATHHAWYYGAPGISRCLYLAAQAINDSNLLKFAEQTLLSNLLKSDQDKEGRNLSFSFGQAGVLAITAQMAKDTKNPELFKQARLLEEGIKKFHHPHHEFGFQSSYFDEKGSPHWNNNPSLLDGAAGIGLTLLQMQDKQEMHWTRPFVIA